jgi:phosphatidylglycerophosphatase A
MSALGKAARAVIVALATGCYISYIPAWIFPNRRTTGAGLLGTFWGVLMLSWLPIEPVPQLLVWLLALGLSIAIGDAAEKILAVKDDPRIIVDEFIGAWTALLFLPRSGAVVALSFVLFRIFDTWKPAGIRRLGNLPGGWGVVMDDIAAGLASNVLIHMLRLIRPF